MIETSVLDRHRLGDHACVIVDDDRSRLAALAVYIRAGLRDDDRVLYLGPGGDELLDGLAGLGFDGAGARNRGQLLLSTPEESYLASGAFDPEVTMGGWRHETALARAAGYRGLRAIGDMSWAARPVPGADRLIGYEAQVNRVFADGSAMAICLYDRRLFGHDELRRATWSHLSCVDHATAPGARPGMRAVRLTDPPGVRLEGEADLSNRHALQALLEHLVEDTPPVEGPLTVDIADLRFADDAAVRVLLRTVAAGAPRLRVVGCSPAIQRLLTFNGAEAIAR
ncbi:MEDS domain-containing protein [Actinoplanes sp. M2I2]|uniref:MEDS domain-containing protein n=1 Tax=Actinoplanes sp. M2I2 TaxID=1734444 RepID=UPI00202097B7|nr:MEDS domain-containing protein [Actinoplanes sp. M2I2]